MLAGAMNHDAAAFEEVDHGLRHLTDPLQQVRLGLAEELAPVLLHQTVQHGTAKIENRAQSGQEIKLAISN